MGALSELTGLSISSVENVHDYMQVKFFNGAVLTIYNNCRFEGGAFCKAVGSTVKSATDSGDEVVIMLEGGGSIHIGLQEDDYVGPEAMVLSQEGAPDVVWN